MRNLLWLSFVILVFSGVADIISTYRRPEKNPLSKWVMDKWKFGGYIALNVAVLYLCYRATEFTVENMGTNLSRKWAIVTAISFLVAAMARAWAAYTNMKKYEKKNGGRG